MKYVLLAAVLTFASFAHAGDAADKAYDRAKIAAAADVGSTLVGIGMGIAVEGNPLGVVGMIAVKAVALTVVPELPDEKKLDFSNKMTTVWGALSVSNVCLLLGGGPACYLFGVAAGVSLWDNRVKPEIEVVWEAIISNQGIYEPSE